MNQKSDGMNYAPEGRSAPVVERGEFVFAATAFEHGHIYAMCQALADAGGELRYVCEPDAAKVAKLRATFPEVQVVENFETLLEKTDVHLIAAAAIPNERGPLGLRVMAAGKDYFTDKAPFTDAAQLAAARSQTAATGRKFFVYYGERLHSECAVRAGQLIAQGAIGRVVQVLGLGPHRSSPSARPDWFWSREKSGGILCDLGSHQCEQFLHFTGALDAEVVHATVANYAHREFPEFEDWGEASLVADNGATNYIRVDWLTPAGLRTWGDGRTFILGTKGSIELRKYLEIGGELEGDHLYLADEKGEHLLRCHGQVGYPFFGELILDCLNRTERAMTQEHIFKAAELCLRAQEVARRIEG